MVIVLGGAVFERHHYTIIDPVTSCVLFQGMQRTTCDLRQSEDSRDVVRVICHITQQLLQPNALFPGRGQGPRPFLLDLDGEQTSLPQLYSGGAWECVWPEGEGTLKSELRGAGAHRDTGGSPPFV